MPARNTYPQQYIDECRHHIDTQVAAYRALVPVASDVGGGEQFDSAVREFEPVFFNNMVLVLENHFMHRTRDKEGEDGNPLNEVRVLSASLTSNNGRMAADKTINMNPETSVLKYAVGDVIAVREADFVALADAFFADLERKFLQ